MPLRVLNLLLCQILGGILGWLLSAQAGLGSAVVLGVFLGGAVWALLDLSRGLQVLQWLRQDDFSQAPVRLGLWGEVAERVRRLVHVRTRQARENQERLQELLAAIQASPNGVILLDGLGRIEWVNRTAAAHFGIDPQRDLLQHLGNLVRDPGFAAYLARKDSEGSIVVPGRGSTPTRPVRLDVQLHAYGDGRRLLLSRDVTALEQAEAMRRDFVANVSHEIRTPLTVLSGFVETLQTLPLAAAEQARYLDLMAQQTQRMQSLVSDLLTLSRLEGSPLPNADQWSNLQDWLVQIRHEAMALSTASHPNGAVNHQLQFDETPSLELAGNPTELFSALSNLVSNAVRYTPAGGVIHVGWRWLADGRGEFFVRDNGPGIAPQHLTRLTERFYRVDRSRSRESGGTGLGLAIVKHVVQRHDAELRIESVEGQGSVFSVVFPRARVRVPSSATAAGGASADVGAA